MASANNSEQRPMQSLMIPPEERRQRSTQLLDGMAEFEESQGFPLLERHWSEDESSSSTSGGRSESPLPIGIGKLTVLRSWSPTNIGSDNNNINLRLPADGQGSQK